MPWYGPIQPRPGELLVGFLGVRFDPPLDVGPGSWLYAADNGRSLYIDDWGGKGRRRFALTADAWRPE